MVQTNSLFFILYYGVMSFQTCYRLSIIICYILEYITQITVNIDAVASQSE